MADEAVLQWQFLSFQSEQFTNPSEGSLTWHDSCTLPIAGSFEKSVRNRQGANRAMFHAAATLAVGGSLIPEPGGVPVQDEQKRMIGAVGVMGDTSDNDEATTFAGPGGCESYLTRSMRSGHSPPPV